MQQTSTFVETIDVIERYITSGPIDDDSESLELHVPASAFAELVALIDEGQLKGWEGIRLDYEGATETLILKQRHNILQALLTKMADNHQLPNISLGDDDRRPNKIRQGGGAEIVLDGGRSRKAPNEALYDCVFDQTHRLASCPTVVFEIAFAGPTSKPKLGHDACRYLGGSIAAIQLVVTFEVVFYESSAPNGYDGVYKHCTLRTITSDMWGISAVEIGTEEAGLCDTVIPADTDDLHTSYHYIVDAPTTTGQRNLLAVERAKRHMILEDGNIFEGSVEIEFHHLFRNIPDGRTYDDIAIELSYADIHAMFEKNLESDNKIRKETSISQSQSVAAIAERRSDLFDNMNRVTKRIEAKRWARQ